MIPSDLKYSKEHSWVKVEQDRAVMGITAYAQDRLGAVVYIDLPGIGEKVKQKTKMTTIESLDGEAEIYAPVSGEVIEVNDNLQHSPELINQDPYGEGWMVVIEPSDPGEFPRLLSAEEYERYLRTEAAVRRR
ncbi:MAG: glycine cleavage system protein GcvH [Firmicutes bacterium]|nr:glycine cleavage system protein GcvH [Bacillota bacterium]